MDIREINRRVIDQFRAGGPIEGMQRDRLVLLTTTGRRSGEPRTTPMMFHRDGDRVLVIASNVGAAAHPDWYRNLVADPHVTVEIGDETYPALATTTEGADRERVWAVLKETLPVLRRPRGEGRAADHPGGGAHPCLATTSGRASRKRSPRCTPRSRAASTWSTCPSSRSSWSTGTATRTCRPRMPTRSRRCTRCPTPCARSRRPSWAGSTPWVRSRGCGAPTIPPSSRAREKSAWDWTMMISQPAWITPDVVEAAMRKKPVDGVRFAPYAEGHERAGAARRLLRRRGAPSSPRLHREYLPEHGFTFNGRHHEVYLSDPRRTAAGRSCARSCANPCASSPSRSTPPGAGPRRRCSSSRRGRCARSCPAAA